MLDYSHRTTSVTRGCLEPAREGKRRQGIYFVVLPCKMAQPRYEGALIALNWWEVGDALDKRVSLCILGPSLSAAGRRRIGWDGWWRWIRYVIFKMAVQLCRRGNGEARLTSLRENEECRVSGASLPRQLLSSTSAARLR